MKTKKNFDKFHVTFFEMPKAFYLISKEKHKPYRKSNFPVLLHVYEKESSCKR